VFYFAQQPNNARQPTVSENTLHAHLSIEVLEELDGSEEVVDRPDLGPVQLSAQTHRYVGPSSRARDISG